MTKTPHMSEALRFYLLTNKLKYIIRTYCLEGYWNIPHERLESVAEHVYGTCMIAIALDSEYDLGIDINHVIKMLVCHEIEELVIGDITPFDDVTDEEKLAEGQKGIDYILGNLIKKDEYIALLDEFEAKETEEAQFAFFCDKIEVILQANIYDDAYHVDLETAGEKLLNDPKIKSIRAAGFNNLGDIFVEFDRLIRHYESFPPFLNILNEIQITDTTFVLGPRGENRQDRDKANKFVRELKQEFNSD